MAKILITDDNRPFADNLGEILEDVGHTVVIAESGEAALSHVQQTRFDVLLSDMRMPEMGGAELVHRVRRLDPGLPAIVVTAFTNDNDLATARAEGLSDFRVRHRDGGQAFATDGEVVALRRIVPMPGNADALGVNAMSIPAARAAIEATRRTGKAAANLETVQTNLVGALATALLVMPISRAVGGGTRLTGPAAGLRGRGSVTGRICPIVAAGPLVIITMRSDSSTASSTSCVTMTTVLRVRATIFSSSSCSLARVSASSAPKGSSISSTFGSMASARAMPTRCFMPPEISCGCLPSAWSMPTRASAASVRCFSCARDSVAANTRSTARCTFSKALSQGSSEWFWNTTARSGPGAAISRLSHSSTPSVGNVSPAIRLSSVLLPQPEWPISVTNSPCATSRSISRSAWKRPLRVANTISTPWMSMKLFMVTAPRS